MKAVNVNTNVELHFAYGTSPDWAVRYAYAEEHGRMSELFNNSRDAEYLDLHFPTRKTILLDNSTIGDWVSIKDANDE